MSREATFWRHYWSRLDDAGHRYSSRQWIEFCARELLLFCPEPPVRALELGCGDGLLYSHWRQHFASYLGADFSPTMLAKFRARWPDARVLCADASCLPLAGGKFDFVFSNQLCQYLDVGALGRTLAQISGLLDSEGVCLIGNIPDRHLSMFYHAGGLRGDRDGSWLRLLRRLVALHILRKRDELGCWYSRRSIARIASDHGFACSTFSSASLEYRFHAVLRKRTGQEPLA